MRSAGLLALVTAMLALVHCAKPFFDPEGSQVGEPAEQSGVVVPFGQVVGDDVVGGFESFAFSLGGGASVDIGGGQLDMPEDFADAGQRHACLGEVHGEGYLYSILRSARSELVSVGGSRE